MIMRPYKEHINKALTKIADIEIDMVCPSHGPILTEDIQYYMDFYEKSAARYYKKYGEQAGNACLCNSIRQH